MIKKKKKALKIFQYKLGVYTPNQSFPISS